MIYFIKSGEYVKVGYSKTRKNGNNRIKSLQIGNPIKLEMLFMINGDMLLEREFHSRFKKYHANGEWFRYDSEVFDTLQSLQTPNPILFSNKIIDDVTWLNMGHVSKIWSLLRHTYYNFPVNERRVLYSIFARMLFTHLNYPTLTDSFLEVLYDNTNNDLSTLKSLIQRKLVMVNDDKTLLGISMFNLALTMPDHKPDKLYGLTLVEKELDVFIPCNTEYFIMEALLREGGSLPAILKHFNNDAVFVQNSISKLVSDGIIEEYIKGIGIYYQFTENSRNILNTIRGEGLNMIDGFDMDTVLLRNQQ